MNKELTALESLKTTKEFALEFIKNGLDRRVIHGGCDIVETALKEKEKQDKVLEIIVKKGISYTEISLIQSCRDYEEYKYEIGSGHVYYSAYDIKRAIKTKQEFDLLKKVLK